MLVYEGSISVFIMHMLYVCVLCASCGSSQSCILYDLQFVNAGRGWKRLQTTQHTSSGAITAVTNCY